MSWRGWSWVSLVAATLVGAALRLYQLGAASLWLDEAYTYFFVTGPLERSWRAVLDNGIHPPLYYLITRLFAAVTPSEFGLRLSAALAGIVATPLMYQFARQWSNPVAGHIAAWLLALNPFALWYARDARSNSFNLVWVVLLGWLFARLYRRFTWQRWWAMVVVSGLAYLTHYFSTLFALACALFLVARLRHDYVFFRRWTLAQLAAVALISPWFILWWLHPIHSFGIAWIPQPNLSDLPLTLLNLAAGWNERWTISVVMAGALWGVGIGLSLRPAHRREWAMPQFPALTLTWFIAPLVAIFLFSLRRPLYVDRYFIVLLPPLTLLVALGFSSLQFWWRWALTLMAVASALASYPNYVKEDWRGVTAFLRERQGMGEPVHLLDLQDLLPLAYYGFRLPGDTLNAPPPPEAFWTVARDGRETAHRLGEFDVVETPATVTGWLTQNHYVIVEQKDWAGVRLFWLNKGP